MGSRNRARPVRLSRVAESVTTRQRVEARETPTILTEASRPGRLLVQLIRAGWSLNGRYYPAEVLRRDGPRAFPAGTLNFVDHATDTEDEERPAGSLRNLASYQTEAARWDPDRNALIAEVRLFAPWRDAVTDWARSGAVGMSIRAWVYGEPGEREGREGWVVTEFDTGRSVDYVTIPAAGGALLTVIESIQSGRAALAEARSVGVWLESRLHLALTQMGDDLYGNGRLTRPERITLSSAIGDALQAWTARVEADAPQLFERDIYDEPTAGEQPASEAAAAEATATEMQRALSAAVRAAYGGGEGVYVWLRDYDPDRRLVYWERSTEDECRTYRQGYTIGDNGAVALTGEAEQVVARIVYDPVPAGGETQVQAQAEAVAEQAAILVAIPPDVTDGTPPTAPTHLSTSEGSVGVTTPHNTGPAPGTPAGQTTEARPATEQHQPAEASEARVALLEAELTQLRNRATVTAEQLAESQADVRRAVARADAAEAELRRLRGNEAGRTTVDRLLVATESGVPDSLQTLIAPRVHAAILNHVPLTDAGEVDQPALEAAITAAIRAERVHAAQLLEAQGVGRVAGLGAEGDPQMQMSDEELEKGLTSVFKGIGLSAEAATFAAKGR